MSDFAAAFAELAPWVFQFQVEGETCGGGISAVGDVRLAQFAKFAPEAKAILELGSLEGAHTVLLAAQPGVERIVAIEGRAANIGKAELVKRLFRVEKAEFVQANLEATDLAAFGTFDAVFCSGLLYHLPEPWTLLQQLPRVAPKLFIWTHYADDLSANETRHDFRGQMHVEGGPDEPLSGMSATAFWPTLGSLIAMLTRSGYRTIEIFQNDVQHRNARAVTIGASVHEFVRPEA